MPGELRFDVRLGRAARRRRRDGEHPAMRILLLADFTGRTATSAPPPPDRAPTRVDVDSFDALLRHWAPRVLLPADADGGPPTPLEFRDLEAFHPDVLLQQLPAVVTLRELRGRLLDAGTSAAAVAELQRVAAAPLPPIGAPAEPEPDTATLERLLGRSGAPAGAGPATAVDALVRRLVAPHILPAVDPQASHFVAALDEALTTHLRRVLHHPPLQALESAWRAAHWVVSNLETSDDLQLHLLDITKEELATTLAPTGGTVADSALYRLLTGASADDAGWSVLAGDFRFGSTSADVDLLHALGALGASVGAPFLGEADQALLGCGSLGDLPDPRRWTPLDTTAAEAWSALRRSAAAPWLGLALPRLLLRLPYGRATDPVEQFAFEETTVPPRHDAYLWGSPAFACALLLGQAYADAGPAMSPGDRQDIPDLPSHTWVADGATHVTPSSEVVLSERAADAILARGLMPMATVIRENLVRVVRFQSIADPPAGLSGDWA